MKEILIMVGIAFSIVTVLFFWSCCKLSSVESRLEEEQELAELRKKYGKENNI